MLLSRDLIQNPLGSSTVPTPQSLLQPAHPAGTQQLCCDTKLSLPIAFLCSLLNNWDPPLKCSVCSARLAGNWKCSWGFCVAHNKLSWNAEFSAVLGICSLQDGYSQPVRDPNINLKCNYPETLHELPGNSNQHDALICPVYTCTFSALI